MKKLKMIVLASALLLTGCSKSEDKIKEVKKEIMVDAIETSKDLIDQKMYEQAKGVLEFVDKKDIAILKDTANLQDR